MRKQLGDALARARPPARCSCSSSGSARIWPTVMRGLSDAYGSWKIDLHLARAKARAARVSSSAVTSSPSRPMRPAVGSIRRSTSRPTVDLPQPDSPTSASVSPAREHEATRRRPPSRVDERPAERRALATTKCFTRPSATSDGSRRALDADSRSLLVERAPRAGTRRQQALRPPERRARPRGDARRRHLAHRAERAARLRSGSRAAARSCSAPCPRSPASRGRRRSSRGERAEQPDRVGMLRAREQRVDAAPARRPGPAYITTTSSQTSATTPRSWVMRMIAAPLSSRSLRISSRICAWIVTSSAVVGSSAISSSGSQASAIAIITRWRMPPESWCG